MHKFYFGQWTHTHTHTDNTPVTYADPFRMMPPGSHHTPSSPTRSHLYYTAPGSPYEQPTPSRSNTIVTDTNQHSIQVLNETDKMKDIELAAILLNDEINNKKSSSQPEIIKLDVLSHSRLSSGGDRSGGDGGRVGEICSKGQGGEAHNGSARGGKGVKIYEEGVYHEPFEVRESNFQMVDNTLS